MKQGKQRTCIWSQGRPWGGLRRGPQGEPLEGPLEGPQEGQEVLAPVNKGKMSFTCEFQAAVP